MYEKEVRNGSKVVPASQYFLEKGSSKFELKVGANKWWKQEGELESHRCMCLELIFEFTFLSDLSQNPLKQCKNGIDMETSLRSLELSSIRKAQMPILGKGPQKLTNSRNFGPTDTRTDFAEVSSSHCYYCAEE